MSCRICYSKLDTRNIPLYISGSEGLKICHECELELLDHIRSMMRTAYRAKKVWDMEHKLVRRNKEE